MESISLIKKNCLSVVTLIVLILFLTSTFYLAEGRKGAGPIWGPYLTLKNRSTIVINWKSDRPTAGTVKYDTSDFYLREDRLRRTKEGNKKERLFHHVELSKLKPATKYVYRISDRPGSGGVNRFETPEKQPERFSFLVYGDSQTCAIRHRLVASEMALDPFDPSFVLHAGDLVVSPISSHWADFFWAIEPLSSSTPLLPTLGNHEKNDESYYKAFALPEGDGNYGKQWYSFSYGRTKFIVLDSNSNLMGLSNFIAERNWLEKQLKENDRPVTVVMFHHPIYSSVYSTGADTGLASSWGALFEKYGVDLVFSGHVHSYERIEKNGITYIVTGGGGGPTGSLSSSLDTSQTVVDNALHYVRVVVNESELELQMVEVARLDGGSDRGRTGCYLGLRRTGVIRDEAVIRID